MSDKIKVAQLVGNAAMGGVSSEMLNYYRYIDRDKFQFDFFTYGKAPIDDEIKALGGNVYYLPSFIHFFGAMRAFKRILKTNHYDIVHSNLTSLSVFPLCSAWLNKVKIRICHAHSTTDGKEKTAIVKNFLKIFCPIFANARLACGKLSAEWFYGKRRSKKVRIMPNAIDAKRFAFNNELREKVRKDYSINGLCIGAIGRFEYQKNFSFLLDVLSTLDNKDVCLAFVGHGSLEEELHSRTDFLQLTDRVIFLPECRDVEKYYSAFDVLALPSRYEGVPLVGLEAQANGLPCLFSNNISDEAVVCNNVRILSIDSVDEWVQALSLPLDRVECPIPLLQEKNYDIQSEARRLTDFYYELINR